MSDRSPASRLVTACAALFFCVASAVMGGQDIAAASAPPSAGLLWNRTGLPAVFPLQVKTSGERDYVVTLTDARTGDPALAAYIEGGAFFKVLVPPGVFRLSFATGEVWQGEETLFGPGAATQVFELQAPLTFETRGLGVKAGHVVDILQHAPDEPLRIAVKDQFICQSFRPGVSVARRPGLLTSEENRRVRNAGPALTDGPVTSFERHRFEKQQPFENRHNAEERRQGEKAMRNAPDRPDVRARFCE